MQNFLSVCIPSYNRAKLYTCLEKLVPAAKKFNWPVYIQDNYMGDAFDISGFDYDKLFYSQNQYNIGLDLNMFKVLRRAGTKYVLWLGDDDIIDVNKAALIHEYIKQSPDFVILSGASDKKKIFKSAKDFYLHYEPNPIYFGNIIVRTDFLDDFDEKLYINSAPFHVYNLYINNYLCKIESLNSSCLILIDNSAVITLGGGGRLGEKVISK